MRSPEGGPCDEYVLFGGRNDDRQSEEFVQEYSKRMARRRYDEFASASADEGWPAECAGRMRRSRWPDEEWAAWNQTGNHRRWAEEEWGAWNQNGIHRTWTEEEWGAWGKNGSHRRWAEGEWIAWNANGNHRHRGAEWGSWRDLGRRSRLAEEERGDWGCIGSHTRSEEECGA